MFWRIISVTVSMVSVVAMGCAGDDGSTETNASTVAAGSTGAAASSDDAGETAADTGQSPTSGETGHSLTSTETGASPTSTGTAGADETAAGEGTTGDNGVAAYCDCVFVTCHEAYHARWGEDEFTSRAACEAEAGALTPAGVSCRMAACEAVASEAECTDAIAPPRCE